MENKKKKFFPLFTDLTEKKAVVIGAGNIAARRIQTILPFVGELTVIAPACTDFVKEHYEKGNLVYKAKTYEREDLYDADLVIAATDDRKVNEDIYSACKCLGILVNVASDQQKCDFHFPGIIEHEGVVIGFNGGGIDHKKVKEIRQKTEKALKDFRGGDAE